jgi:hypothetical protein
MVNRKVLQRIREVENKNVNIPKITISLRARKNGGAWASVFLGALCG